MFSLSLWLAFSILFSVLFHFREEKIIPICILEVCLYGEQNKSLRVVRNGNNIHSGRDAGYNTMMMFMKAPVIITRWKEKLYYIPLLFHCALSVCGGESTLNKLLCVGGADESKCLWKIDIWGDIIFRCHTTYWRFSLPNIKLYDGNNMVEFRCMYRERCFV